jgi:DtxR family Mn-dependent transcriptional regulator
MELSVAEENYIKAIYGLRQNVVATNTIAQVIETKASSVTDMLQKLAEKNLVNYVKYKGVSLTETGEQVALNTLRKHRLWEVFLVEKLGFGWDEVHDIAEQLEHIRSEKLTEKLDTFLGSPNFDPHGDPIPNSNGQMPNRSLKNLSECSPGQTVIIERVKDGNPAFLQYLERVNLTIGDTLVVTDFLPFDNSMEVLLPNQVKLILSTTVTQNLYIRHI